MKSFPVPLPEEPEVESSPRVDNSPDVSYFSVTKLPVVFFHATRQTQVFSLGALCPKLINFQSSTFRRLRPSLSRRNNGGSRKTENRVHSGERFAERKVGHSQVCTEWKECRSTLKEFSKDEGSSLKIGLDLKCTRGELLAARNQRRDGKSALRSRHYANKASDKKFWESLRNWMVEELQRDQPIPFRSRQYWLSSRRNPTRQYESGFKNVIHRSGQ